MWKQQLCNNNNENGEEEKRISPLMVEVPQRKYREATVLLREKGKNVGKKEHRIIGLDWKNKKKKPGSFSLAFTEKAAAFALQKLLIFYYPAFFSPYYVSE